MSRGIDTVDTSVSALKLFAVQAHEAFTEFVSAGFTESQAIQIVVGLSAKDIARGSNGETTL